MKAIFLNKKNNKKLIVFFNGWGMDYRAVSLIPPEDFDIVMLNEYQDLSVDSSFTLGYDSIFVVAWSLGVWVANSWLLSSAIKPTKTIAINGTVQPIDNKNGITPAVFQGTINNWDELNRTRFQLRMFNNRLLFAKNINKLPIRNIGEQKNELEMLQIQIVKSTPALAHWNKVFIGIDDLVFTAENQLHFWKNKSEIIQIQMPHFPFLLLNTWGIIIE